MTPPNPIRRLLARLIRERSGVALTEFAFVAPIMLTLGVAGTELAYYVTTHMRVSQVAMQVSDTAARIGEHDVLVSRKLYEHDVNDMFVGAEKLAGDLDIYEHGRIIVSSLEQNADGGQWVHWQRCRGMKTHTSSYGVAGDGETGTNFPGMGKSGKEITASAGNAVMFVEIAYDYQPITPLSNLDDTTITYTAAFNVRDARDLTQIYNTSSPAAQVANCGQYTN